LQPFFDEHNDQIRRLVQKFSGYSVDIDAETLRSWIRQFDEEDWNLALKILEWVNYYSNDRIVRELQSLSKQIKVRGFNLDNSYFAPFCRVGHSGEIILERYRFANKLKSRKFDDHFIHLSKLNLLYDQRGASLYFLEDFIGTGNQTLYIWDKIADFVPPNNDLYLLVIVGHEEGIKRVVEKLPLEVVCNRTIYENEKIFSDANNTFSDDEKRRIREYCNRAGEWPEGYGRCQSNVVFYYRAPNNTISILRANNPKWKGLFIRNL